MPVSCSKEKDPPLVSAGDSESTDIGRIDAMSDIDDIGPPGVVGLSDRFVSKDQV